MKTESIVLTVHNKEWLVEEVIARIFKHTNSLTELVVVLDGCTDNSEAEVDEVLKLTPDHFKVKVLHTPDVFETRANNVGMKVATGDYIIIVQDDMLINETDWNLRLRKPLETFSDVFGCTARCSHNWRYNPNSAHQHTDELFDGQWSDLINHTDHADKRNTPRDVFAIRDSSNRGPLLLDHSVLQKVNYLDEEFSPLDLDDHDLSYRVYKQLGLVTGYYGCDVISEDAWGGTRVETGQPANWHLRANQKNAKLLFSRHKDLIVGQKHDENRSCK